MTTLKIDSGMDEVARQLLFVQLEQEQWKQCLQISEWLTLLGDEIAAVIRVKALCKLKRWDEALDALCHLPVEIRREKEVRRIEASLLYTLGYHQYAKQVYLLS